MGSGGRGQLLQFPRSPQRYLGSASVVFHPPVHYTDLLSLGDELYILAPKDEHDLARPVIQENVPDPRSPAQSLLHLSDRIQLRDRCLDRGNTRGLQIRDERRGRLARRHK